MLCRIQLIVLMIALMFGVSLGGSRRGGPVQSQTTTGNQMIQPYPYGWGLDKIRMEEINKDYSEVQNVNTARYVVANTTCI